MIVPSLILKQLYTFGSLTNVEEGVVFEIKNRLSDAKIERITSLSIGGETIDFDDIVLDLGDSRLSPNDVSPDNPLDFPLKRRVKILTLVPNLPEGRYKIVLGFKASPFGKLKLKVDCSIVRKRKTDIIPRDTEDDYSEEAIKNRQAFLEEYTGKKLEHVTKYSFDPHISAGNCEHFTGVAQVPIGIAGPIKINGEHAQGEFIVPLATAEGTLVASYNRGIKLLNMAGGAKCTVVDDAMQRAPVFVFEDARGARNFVKWIKENFDEIAEHAESTTSIGKLKYIDPYLANKFAYLRFNFSTGDAAGQNMVGRATFAACSWILDTYHEEKMTHFYLESNLATDKKASQVNIMHTRGKRVTAECTIPRDVLIEVMRVEPESLQYHYQVANIGALLSGANNNGLHSANGITAMFIATGQDVANVSKN